MKKIIILVFAVFSILILNVNQAHATILPSSPGVRNLVMELDFNYPETNYVYYGVSGTSSFDSDYAMGEYLYNDTLKRYNFINYLWFQKDQWVYGDTDTLIVDIYLPKRRSINGITYNLEWGMFSYNAFDRTTPILLDNVLDSDYIALKFIYYDVPAENKERFDMYILDNTGNIYTSQIFNGLDYARFNKNYSELPTSDFNLFVNLIEYDSSSYESGYDNGLDDGFNNGMREYGYYDGTDYITADEWADKRYNDGLGQNRNFYGYLYNGNWLTAEEWGDIRYDVGYDNGLSGEIDWFSWATTFFLMPFKILNIQILPGIRIGYFALFSLLLGVVGWFFFLVGKGGGRRK